jgi:hypothetical protein
MRFMRRNRIHTAVLAAALLAVGPSPLHAQLDMVNGLFEEVNALTIFYQRGWVADGDMVSGNNLNGAGLEVLIELASGDYTTLELGLGASYLRGYEAEDDLLDLRTSVRALPTVTLYASRDVGQFSGYFGLSFGLVDLWNAQAYDTAGRPWSIEAQTFELGGSLGTYWTGPAGIGFFLEGGYRERRFPSAKWTIPDGASLPDRWRSLNLSGYYAQAGIQLRVKEEDKNDAITPPAPAGIWTLERIDGAVLPGTIDTTQTGRTRLLHAVLRLEATNDSTGTYVLERNVQQYETGRIIAPDMMRESGSYTIQEKAETREHVLTFRPDVGGDARTAERLAGRLYLNWKEHVLVFAPGNAPPPSK